jgi:hypothetical protein
MPKIPIQNTFNEGMKMDFPVYQTPDNVVTYAENLYFVTHNGNELIIQTPLGNEYTTLLKPNYVPVGNKTYNGICYILSAEYVNFRFTGRGEVGSFPSPNYDSFTNIDGETWVDGDKYGYLEYNYKPLKNYLGDNIDPNGVPKTDYINDFNSIYFNFQIDKPLEVEIQPVYDNSVNIIFTDNFNKPRTLNSRFSVLPANKYVIRDRIGNDDSNLYNRLNWDNTLNLILTTKKILNIDLDSQGTGSLPAGNYKYYFQLCTQDGNCTDIIGESFDCSVYFGNAMTNIRGGQPNESTNKSNVLILGNLDESYSYVKVSYVYKAGDLESINNAFVLENKYFISDGNTLRFEHTGTERTQVLDITTLSVNNASIDTFRTMTQVAGRLFAANIKNKFYDYKEFFEYASTIKTYYDTKKLVVPGYDNDYSGGTFQVTLPIDYKNPNGSYGAGYYSPKNIYYQLGYWGAESYVFGIVFKMKDGSYSTVFPLRGIDSTVTNTYSNTTLNTDDPFDETTGENINGIFRFPTRDTVPLSDELYYANMLYPTFEIPTPPQAILDDTLGFMIVRCKKKSNIITQGYIIDTLPIPFLDAPNDNVNFIMDYEFNDTNYKLIPSVDWLLESHLATHDDDDLPPDGKDYFQEFLYKFVYPMSAPNSAYLRTDVVNKNFALISPDLLLNSEKLVSSLEANSDVKMKLLSAISMQYAIASQSKFFDATNGNGSTDLITTSGGFSLYKPILHTPYNQLLTAKNYFQINNQYTYNAGRFSSKMYLVSAPNLRDTFLRLDDNEYRVNEPTNGNANFRLSFDSYIGISVENQTNLFQHTTYQEPIAKTSSFVVYNGKVRNPIYEEDYVYPIVGKTVSKPLAYLVNLYQDGTNNPNGYYPTPQLFDLYKPEYETFFPITKEMYWDNAKALEVNSNASQFTSLENERLLRPDGRLEGFNGDNYIGTSFRKLYWNNIDLTEVLEKSSQESNLGLSLQLLTESNFNPGLRTDNLYSVDESEKRSFLPYYTKGNYGGENAGNVWKKSKLPETTVSNKGYSDSSSGKNYIALKSDNPFIEDRFDTRIIYSELYTSNSFVDGYRKFAPIARQDYQKHLGAIVAIKNLNGQLICVFENGLHSIPVNQRRQSFSDAVGSVFIESAGVLPPVGETRTISELYGSKWQWSILNTDNTVYGVDIDKGKIWQFTGDSLKLISDFNVQSFLRSINDRFQGQVSTWFKHDIRTYYDVKKNDVIFSFLSEKPNNTCGTIDLTEIIPFECPVVEYNNNVITITGGREGSTKIIKTPVECFDDDSFKTLVYFEMSDKWQTFLPYSPHMMFTLYDKLFSFPYKQDTIRNTIWKHESPNVPYCNYYNEQDNFVFEFVVTKDTTIHQVFNNLMIVSNESPPTKIEMTTDNDTYEMLINLRDNTDYFSIYKSNTYYKENHYYITIQKENDDIHKQSFFKNKRVRDKYCKFRITYPGDKYTQVQRIITTILQSFS